VSFFVPASAGFKSDIQDVTAARYWKLLVDTDNDGDFSEDAEDLTEYLEFKDGGLSGGARRGSGASWMATIADPGGVSKGDYADYLCAVEAKVADNEYIRVFTGYVTSKGLELIKSQHGKDRYKIYMFDATKRYTKVRMDGTLLANYVISDTDSPATSIFHHLITALGLTASDIVVGIIDKTKDFVEIEDNALVWNEIRDLVEQYMGPENVFGFRYDGKLLFNSMFETGYTDPTTEWTLQYAVDDSDNVHKLTGSGGDIICDRAITKFVEVEDLGARTVYQNLETYDETLDKIAIDVAAGEAWPGGSRMGDIATLEYADPATGEELWANSITTPTIGATGADKDIECDGGTLTLLSFNGTNKLLSFQASAYTSAVAGDIGKTVTGGTSGDTGTLLSYDNTNRVWWVDTTDDFAISEAMTIGGGTGAGTTYGPATTTRQTASSSEIVLYNNTGSTITITKMQVRGNAYLLQKDIIVEDKDLTVTNDYDYVTKTIPGKYAADYSTSHELCEAWVTYGKETKDRITATIDWLPQIQCGALITLNEAGSSISCIVDWFKHPSCRPTMQTQKTQVGLIKFASFTSSAPISARILSRGGAAALPYQEGHYPTYEEISEGWSGYGTDATTTPAKVTGLQADAFFRDIHLRWDAQYDLTNCDHYEVQVSDDDSTWYSLKFDGSDWKDTLNQWTTVYTTSLVHTHIPNGGTQATPAGQTLYYRVRAVTHDNTQGTASDSASATTYPIVYGDIAENGIGTEQMIVDSVTDQILDSTEGDEAVVASVIRSGSFLYIKDEGLLAHWSFDDLVQGNAAVDGDTIRDNSGQGNHAEAEETPDFVEGIAGSALDFNGSDERLIIPADILGGETAATWSVWFTSDGYDQYSCVASDYKIAAGKYGWIFGYQYNATTLRCAWGDGTNTDFLSASYTWGDDSDLHHLVCVFRASGTCELWLDGQLQDSKTTAIASIGTFTNDAADRSIARYASTYWWDGKVDEFRIYNRDLAEAEIKYLYMNPGVIQYRMIHADMIQADVISTLVARVQECITIDPNLGFLGQSRAIEDPEQDGDRRTYIDSDEITFQEYSDPPGTWGDALTVGGSNQDIRLSIDGKGIGNPAASAEEWVLFRKNTATDYSGNPAGMPAEFSNPGYYALSIEADSLVIFAETDDNLIRGWFDVNAGLFGWMPDEDIYAEIGRAWIGYNGVNADRAFLGHLDCRNGTDYALQQSSSGHTILNCKSGTAVYIDDAATYVARFYKTGDDVYMNWWDVDDTAWRSWYLDTSASQFVFGSDLTYMFGGNMGIGVTPTTEMSIGAAARINRISTGTADASDTKLLRLCGGGDGGAARGAYIDLSGNEDAGTGALSFVAGNVVGGNIYFSAGGAERMRITKDGDVEIGPNVDKYAFIGRAWIGYDGASGDEAMFGHYDQRGATSFALAQSATGSTKLNCASGQQVRIAEGDAAICKFTKDGDDAVMEWWDVNDSAYRALRFDTSESAWLFQDAKVWIQQGGSSLFIGENGGGDTTLSFYDDADNSWRTITLDTSEDRFTMSAPLHVSYGRVVTRRYEFLTSTTQNAVFDALAPYLVEGQEVIASGFYESDTGYSCDIVSVKQTSSTVVTIYMVYSDSGGGYVATMTATDGSATTMSGDGTIVF